MSYHHNPLSHLFHHPPPSHHNYYTPASDPQPPHQPQPYPSYPSVPQPPTPNPYSYQYPSYTPPPPSPYYPPYYPPYYWFPPPLSADEKDDRKKGDGKGGNDKKDKEGNKDKEKDKDKGSDKQKGDAKKIPDPALLTLLDSSCGPSTISYDLRDFPSQALIYTTPSPSLSLSHRNPNSLTLTPSTFSPKCLESSITHPPSPHIKLLSPYLPWSIDVWPSSPSASVPVLSSAKDKDKDKDRDKDRDHDKEPERQLVGVTVADVLDAIHEALHYQVTEGEWWATSDASRANIGASCLSNCEVASETYHSTFGYGYGKNDGKGRTPVKKTRKKEQGVKRVDWLVERHILRGLHRDEELVKLRVRDKKMWPYTWVLTLGTLD